jgi:hypothetical protein
VRPERKPNPRKAQITKIATVCLGALFVVLLVKTIAGKGKATAPPRRAAAEPRVTEEVGVPISSPRAETKTRIPDGDPTHQIIPSLPDSAGVVPPPNPFRMTPRLKEELTGIRQTRKPSATPPQKPRIKFKLQGIVADLKNGEHVALIDDELLRIGDLHRGYTVLEITRAQVILDDGEDRRVLQLEEK